jgi:hypothetical protein
MWCTNCFDSLECKKNKKKGTWEVDLPSATTKTLGKEAPLGKWLCRVQQPRHSAKNFRKKKINFFA